MCNGTAALCGAPLYQTITNDMTTKKQPSAKTRGLRNCNPGNIRHNAANKWLGMRPMQTDPEFVQFIKMSYGYRALMRLLQNYAKRGVCTVDDIIMRWAPASENNTRAYIRTVCRLTGFAPDYRLRTDNQTDMQLMAAAISQVENGCQADYAEVNAGWKLLMNAEKAED